MGIYFDDFPLPFGFEGLFPGLGISGVGLTFKSAASKSSSVGFFFELFIK